MKLDPERICPMCRVERADWEHDDGGYLESCPNCGTADDPTPPTDRTGRVPAAGSDTTDTNHG